MKFKKKLNKEETDVLLHDLECLELKDTKDNKYHYNLLKNNILDLGKDISFKKEINGMSVERNIACQVLSEFEEFLSNKNIEIPNKEKDEYNEEEGDDTETAILFGTDYYNLEEEITEVIKRNHPKIVDDNLIRGILRTTFDIIEKKFSYGISEDDKGFIEDLAIKELCEVELD